MSLASRLRAAGSSYAGFDRRIWVLAWVRAVNTMGMSLVMTFMGMYLVIERDVSGWSYGVIYFVANLCQALANSYAGQMSDRVGRRHLMIVAVVSRAAVIALLGWLVLVHASVAALSVVLVLSATLRGGFEPVASAVVADVASPEQRVAAFGLQRMGVNVGWLVGPSLGGLLASLIDYGYVFFCAMVPILLSAIPLVRMREPSVHSAASRAASESLLPTRRALRDTSGVRRRSELGVLLGCAMLFSVVHVQLFSTFSIYAKSEVGLSEQQIGFLFAINGLAVVLLQVPAVALLARVRHERALVVGPLLYVVAFLGIGAADDYVTLGAAVLLTTVGEVVIAPAQQATVAELGEPTRLGHAYGVFGTMQMLGVALAPLVGGLAYDQLRHRPLAMWSCLAVLALILAVAYGRYGVLRRRRLVLDNPGR